MLDKQSKNKPVIQWANFAGLASQWAVALAGLLYLGKFLDKWMKLSVKTPIFIWLLPFFFIIFSLIRIIKSTNTKQ